MTASLESTLIILKGIFETCEPVDRGSVGVVNLRDLLRQEASMVRSR